MIFFSTKLKFMYIFESLSLKPMEGNGVVYLTVLTPQLCGKNARSMSLKKKHLMIMDGHAGHVEVNVVHKTKAVGLEIINLPFIHTSYTLPCFKSFNATIRACCDS